jgi:hypothetical protein
MKKSVFFTLLLILSVPIMGEAQLKAKSYRVRVELFNGLIAKGHLIALHDSSIHVSTWTRPRADTEFLIGDIKKLSLRRRNAPERGFGIGAAVGTAVGAAVGYMTYESPDCDGSSLCFDFGPGYSVLGGAFTGAIVGGVIGLAGGSGYTDYIIDGDQTDYALLRSKLLNGPASTLERK